MTFDYLIDNIIEELGHTPLTRQIIETLRSQQAQIQGLNYDLRKAVESDIDSHAKLVSRTAHYEIRLQAADELASVAAMYGEFDLNQAITKYRTAGETK